MAARWTFTGRTGSKRRTFAGRAKSKRRACAGRAKSKRRTGAYQRGERGWKGHVAAAQIALSDVFY